MFFRFSQIPAFEFRIRNFLALALNLFFLNYYTHAACDGDLQRLHHLVTKVQYQFPELGIASKYVRRTAELEEQFRNFTRMPAYKMLRKRYQFAINYSDPTLQNRQRHSIYVSNTARDIAARLGLLPASRTLASTIALAHDFGHPPFSHWGETAIRKRLTPHGIVWDHDIAGLSAAQNWSSSPNYSFFPEVVEGMSKRFWKYDPNLPLGRQNHSAKELPNSILSRNDFSDMRMNELNHLEGQIAAQSDRISFNATDISDGLRIGRFTPEMLKENFPSAYNVYQRILLSNARIYQKKVKFPVTLNEIIAAIESEPALRDGVYRQFAQAFRDFQIDDLISNTISLITRAKANGRLLTAEDVRKETGFIVDFSSRLQDEFTKFMGFCRDHIFAKATAPFEPIVDSVIGKMLDGTIKLEGNFQHRFEFASNEAEKILIIAEYLTRNVSDQDLLHLAQKHVPDVYNRHFPGYETVQTQLLDQKDLDKLLIQKFKPLEFRASEKSGIPIIKLNDIDFSAPNAISISVNPRAYVIPTPDIGETIQIPRDGLRNNGEKYYKGAPIFNEEGNPVSGKGVVFYNANEDHWAAVCTGKNGKERCVLFINDPSEGLVKKLDERRNQWVNPDKPTLQELKSLLSDFPNLSFQPSTISEIENTMHPVNQTKVTHYGYQALIEPEIALATYIPHPFELKTQSGDVQKFYSGGIVLNQGRGIKTVVHPKNAKKYVRLPNGKDLNFSDIPIQRFDFISEYQTTHKVNARNSDTVNIIGMGISGITTATHLVKRFREQALQDHKLVINFIDPLPFPGGPTYNRPSSGNNVGMANAIGILGLENAGSCMETFNKDPEKWMGLIPRLRSGFNASTRTFDASTIITHNEYGLYIKDHLRTLIRDIENQGIKIEINHIRNGVTRFDPSINGGEIWLKGGESLKSDATVIGVGNALPKKIKTLDDVSTHLDGLDGYYRLDDQAWSPANTNETDFTVVLGTGNGALFGSLWAIGNGYKGRFLITSPHGNLPIRAGVSKPYIRKHLTESKLKSITSEAKPITTRILKKLFDQEIEEASKSGIPWQDVVDSLVPDVNKIWSMMSEKEQKRFRQIYEVAWNNARYRMPDEQWYAIEQLRKEGRMDIQGGLVGIRPARGGGFDVLIRQKDGSVKNFFTKKVVNNTGPSKQVSEMPAFVQDLITKKIATVHHAGGLAVNNNFQLINADGKIIDATYALGPTVSGSHPESMTVPAIRESGIKVADNLFNNIVLEKEKRRRKYLDGLKNKFEKPGQSEIEKYANEMNKSNQTTDPRFPNRLDTIPTTEIYSTGLDAQGKRLYSPERLAVHKKIIDQALSLKETDGTVFIKTPSGKKPYFMCVSGGMSVGMTYMQRLLIHQGVVDLNHTVVITPQSFQALHEFAIRSHYQHPEKSPLLVDEYYDIAQKIVQAALDRNLNVVFVDQADSKAPILEMVKMAKEKKYDTAMMGMTMSPEAYYAASQLWQTRFNRLTDHRRGFGDLKEFSQNWDDFSREFDTSHLFETVFHVNDIDKAVDDASRKEYTVRKIASVHSEEKLQYAQTVYDYHRFVDFQDRGRYLNENAKNPKEARKFYPYEEAPQLIPNQTNSILYPERVSQNKSELGQQLDAFTSGDFEQKFIQLVRTTTERRAQQAASRGANAVTEPDKNSTKEIWGEAVNARREKARNPDRQLILRYPEDAVQNQYYESYKTNMAKMIKAFDKEVDQDFSRLTKEQLQEQFINIITESHKILDYRSESPGVFHNWPVTYNDRPEAVTYAQRVITDFNLGNFQEGSLKIEGIPKESWPSNTTGGRHEYPAPQHRQAYLKKASEAFFDILNGLKEGTNQEKLLENIGRYYYLMLHLRPFPQVNNSLFMGHVNYFLNLSGHKGISHSDIDHLMMRLNSEQAAAIWPKILNGELKSARQYGIKIESGKTVK